MIRPLQMTVLMVAALAVSLLCGFVSPVSHRSVSPLIVTAAPVYEPLAALRGGERFKKGAQLLLVRDEQATPLIEGFAATADPSLSYDGKTLLFAGKQNPLDRWSIWEFTFEDRSVRKVLGGDSDV